MASFYDNEDRNKFIPRSPSAVQYGGGHSDHPTATITSTTTTLMLQPLLSNFCRNHCPAAASGCFLKDVPENSLT